MPIFNPPLSEMDNADLVGALAALVDETLDRLEEYADSKGDAIEGLRLAKLADRASIWGGQQRGFGGAMISDYTRSFTSRIVDAATLGDSGRRFGAFLREHPELTEDEAKPEPLDLSDDEALLEAVVAAAQEWAEETTRPDYWDGTFIDAHMVARYLAGKQRGDVRTLTKSDHMRVVAALKRLEKAGRVEVIRREVYGQRAANDYRVKGGVDA